ncbi:MAG: CpsD/CapB family tyrosine-protein kinase [Anaerolineae bacterium]|nr:CpsD/CapB family tyrosine-protein kinase [Caldilineales bacterium]MCX7851820.1 CpsD/CapB family tyrosine-protein kinase [Caldilineales bacterium]MDW8268588.1 CpsD/CapB family tyrosine-protein kinase [Anaerolineae bacterium]
MTSPLITLTDARSPQAEAYRSLRTNLEFYSLDHPLRTLLVTSPAPDEGKSTTLANLGVIHAQAGKRIILLDGDLRRPRLHELFGLSNNTGVTTAILNPEAPLPLQNTTVPNLRVMTSGPLPPNPADLLASARMKALLDHLVAEADLVLLDAPPVIVVTDAVVLAAKVDGVLLVVSAGQTRREHAQRARDLLAKVNARLIGAVLTNAAVDTAAYGVYGQN